VIFPRNSRHNEELVWKRIDGFILDSLKAELERQRRQTSPDWGRFELEEPLKDGCFDEHYIDL